MVSASDELTPSSPRPAGRVGRDGLHEEIVAEVRAQPGHRIFTLSLYVAARCQVPVPAASAAVRAQLDSGVLWRDDEHTLSCAGQVDAPARDITLIAYGGS